MSKIDNLIWQYNTSLHLVTSLLVKDLEKRPLTGPPPARRGRPRPGGRRSRASSASAADAAGEMCAVGGWVHSRCGNYSGVWCFCLFVGFYVRDFQTDIWFSYGIADDMAGDRRWYGNAIAVM